MTTLSSVNLLLLVSALAITTSGCTEARLIRERLKARTTAAVAPPKQGFGIYSGGGTLTGPGVQLQATVGEISSPHEATGAGVTLRSGLQETMR